MNVPRKEVIGLMLLSVVVFFSNIGGYSIYILDEAKNAMCAFEMKETGRFFYPTFNGEIRTDKPPLHYYFMQVGYFLFGKTAFAARFFSALMGVATVMLTFFAVDFLSSNRKMAWYASLILLSSLQIMVQFHLAVPDPYLIFFTNLGIFSFLIFWEKRQKTWILLTYVSLAFAALAKGPVAIVLPSIIFLGFVLVKKSLNWQTIRDLQLLWGIFIFLLITFPVYYQLHVQTEGTWTEGFFFKHNLERFTSVMEGHSGNIFFVPLVILGGLLPFSFFLPQTFVYTWKAQKHSLLLLALIDVVVFGVFFTISRTKLPTYPEPCYPFIAVLIAYFWTETEKSDKNRYFSVSWYVLILVLFFLPFGVWVGLKNHPVLSDLHNFAWFFAILSLGGFIGFYFVRKKQLQIAFIALAASFILLGQIAQYVIMPAIDSFTPTQKGKQFLEKASSVAYFGRLNPAYPFAIGKTIPQLSSPKECEDFFIQNPDAILFSEMNNWKNDLQKNASLKIVFEQKDVFENRHWIFLSKQNYP
ncbi:MAG: glycosyltransferase family 39 protein [Flammeovirgaceae bacterium]|nr:glycosyltransferase family 39 protein [Flammeovirgaceae bacterium]